jgi:protein phosphatase
MGTTAAILLFSEKKIILCNIGDSKVFRISNRRIKQLSVDHIAAAAYGVKPPLSQHLGIPPAEMIIEPYLAQGKYNNRDVYLICSDGLTDMVMEEKILQIISELPFDEASNKLLEQALRNGGKDNITIILCKIEQKRPKILKYLIRRAEVLGSHEC